MTDRQLRAIGALAVNFSALEQAIAIWISGLIGENAEIGLVVASQLPFGKALVVADGLFRIRCTDPAIRAEFESLLKRAGQCEQERNQTMHSSWLSATDGPLRMKPTAKPGRGLRVTVEPVGPEEVEALADRVGQVTADLLRFAMDHRRFHFIGIGTGGPVGSRADAELEVFPQVMIRHRPAGAASDGRPDQAQQSGDPPPS